MLSYIFLFFVGASILGAVAVIRQIIGNQKHLDEETIRNFMLKRLSERDRRRVTTHLGICERCQDIFTGYGQNRPLEDHLIDPDE